jgi:hypothetical protein
VAENHDASSVRFDLACKVGESDKTSRTVRTSRGTETHTSWTEHYRLTRFRRDRPDEKCKREKITCPICGKQVWVTVNSPAEVFGFQIVLGIVLAILGVALSLGAWALIVKTEGWVWLVTALLLVTFAIISLIGSGVAFFQSRDTSWGNVVSMPTKKNHKLVEPGSKSID